MDGYNWVLGFYFIPSFDFSSYGLKDWLQIVAAVVGIGGSTYGAWTAFRYSKSQIAKRLAEYLNDHEKNVDEARQLVVQHLRNDRPMDRKPEIEIHQRIESAIKLVARGHKEDAERELERFALVLSHSSEVGRRHADLAKKQAATILCVYWPDCTEARRNRTGSKCLAKSSRSQPAGCGGHSRLGRTRFGRRTGT